MKTLFAILPVLTSSKRPALITTGSGVGDGVGVEFCAIELAACNDTNRSNKRIGNCFITSFLVRDLQCRVE